MLCRIGAAADILIITHIMKYVYKYIYIFIYIYIYMYMYVDVHTTEGQATFFFVRLRLFLFHQYSTLPLDAFQQRQTWMGVSRPYSSYRSNTQ